MPLGFPPEALESALRFRPRPGDVFVASYPKSGTTWLQYIVYLLLRRRALSPEESLGREFPHLEEVGEAPIAALPEPRLIKTHLSFGLAPYAMSARYIVIARNPFDCAVSFFHHTRGFPRHYDFQSGRFADYFPCFLAGEVDFGEYFAHLLSWWEQAGRGNVLFLTYESLRADPAASIRRIAGFLGGAALATIETEAGLAWVVGESGFDAMSRHQQRWSSRRPESAEAFVRRGVVGDWQSLFTPPMARALLAEFERRLLGTGAEGLWPEVIAAARGFARRADEDRG